MGDVIVLGFLSEGDLRDLRALAPRDVIALDLQRPGRGEARFLPAWMFGLGPPRWSDPQWEGALPPSSVLKLLEVRPFPLWIAARLPLPEAWRAAIPEWAHSIWDRLRMCRATPAIFLTLLVDFLGRLLRDDSSWDAEVVENLVYRDDDPSHPLGHHDPSGSVRTLVKALAAMWEHREHLVLRKYTKFEIPNGLWVRGHRQGTWETIISYCGGRFHKGPCGKWPLVRGRDSACPDCNFLICDRCNHCSKGCVRMAVTELG